MLCGTEILLRRHECNKSSLKATTFMAAYGCSELVRATCGDFKLLSMHTVRQKKTIHLNCSLAAYAPRKHTRARAYAYLPVRSASVGMHRCNCTRTSEYYVNTHTHSQAGAEINLNAHEQSGADYLSSEAVDKCDHCTRLRAETRRVEPRRDATRALILR